MKFLLLLNLKHPYLISLLIFFLFYAIGFLLLIFNNYFIDFLIVFFGFFTPLLSSFFSFYFCKNKIYGFSLIIIYPFLGAFFYYLIYLFGFKVDIPGIQGAFVIFFMIFIFYTLLPVFFGYLLYFFLKKYRNISN